MADFTNPSEDFTAGFNSAQTAADAWRHSRAQNALAAAYGNTVTSLQDAQSQQDLNTSQQLDPIKVQAAQEALGQSKVMDPLDAQGKQLGNQGQQLQNTQGQQTIDDNNMSMQAKKALQLHGVLSASLDTLGQQLAGVTDPTKRGALFDAEVQQLAPLIGADPRVISSQLRAERDRVVQGGADAVPEIQGDLDNLIQAQLTPQEKAQLANLKATGDLTTAQTAKATADAALATSKATAAANTKGLTPAAQAKLDTQKRAAGSALSSLEASNVNVNSAIDQAIKQAQDPRATGPMSNIANLPGVGAAANGPAYALGQTLKTIIGNLGFAKLQDIRANSPTGGSLGSISDFEEKLLQSTIASLDQAQSKEQLVANLNKVRVALKASEDHLRKAYNDDFGGGGAADTSTAAPTDPAVQALLDKYK